MSGSAQYDVAVVGAGAAGIGAARALRDRELRVVVLEAADRVGGRAFTQTLGDGMHVDFGCHWLHSASVNPLVAFADAFGCRYEREPVPQRVLVDGAWAEASQLARWQSSDEDARRALEAEIAAGGDRAIADIVERDGPWGALYDYWVSAITGADPDQVGAADLVNYRETNENWPVVTGYGALVERLGEGLPVRTNAAVQRIDWSSNPVRLSTSQGTLRASHVILTVSTGVLGAGAIEFKPALPAWKGEAVADLLPGANNIICLLLDGKVFLDSPASLDVVLPANDVPMTLRIRPYGTDHVKAYTGGRQAAELERAGVDASADLIKEYLRAMFGSDVTRHVTGHRASAWCADPHVRGAYSFSRPGRFASREILARSVGERLHFAGEATSTDSFATCHGAYLSGIAAAQRIVMV